ncbi:MAG: hypothetical protein JF629_04885 [Variovorax paradoxus]|nr:hypothetical protein [Variovorax paradoxus]
MTTITGSNGNDLLTGTAGSDTINSGNGDDSAQRRIGGRHPDLQRQRKRGGQYQRRVHRRGGCRYAPTPVHAGPVAGGFYPDANRCLSDPSCRSDQRQDR